MIWGYHYFWKHPYIYIYNIIIYVFYFLSQSWTILKSNGFFISNTIQGDDSGSLKLDQIIYCQNYTQNRKNVWTYQLSGSTFRNSLNLCFGFGGRGRIPYMIPTSHPPKKKRKTSPLAPPNKAMECVWIDLSVENLEAVHFAWNCHWNSRTWKWHHLSLFRFSIGKTISFTNLNWLLQRVALHR